MADPPAGFTIDPPAQGGPPAGFEIDKPDSDSGFVEGWNKFGTGVGRGFAGVAGAAADLGEAVNPSFGIYAGQLRKHPEIYDPRAELKKYSEGGPPEGPEWWGKMAGGIAPTLLTPELGVARMLPGAPAVIGTGLEGLAQGAIGGAMTPGDREQNAKTGAMAGGGTALALGGVEAALNAIPPRWRWLAHSVAAGAAAEGIGHLAGLPNWLRGTMWWGLYRARLADLAQQMAGKASRLNMAPVGSIAAHATQEDKPQ
jgi:hypothetical protein